MNSYTFCMQHADLSRVKATLGKCWIKKFLEKNCTNESQKCQRLISLTLVQFPKIKMLLIILHEGRHMISSDTRNLLHKKISKVRRHCDLLDENCALKIAQCVFNSSVWRKDDANGFLHATFERCFKIYVKLHVFSNETCRCVTLWKFLTYLNRRFNRLWNLLNYFSFLQSES